MKYGIQALSPVPDAFVWRWADVEQAQKEARRISETHHVKVIVFEIIGMYSPVVQWEKVEG